MTDPADVISKAANADDPLDGMVVVNALGGFEDLNKPHEGPAVICRRMLDDAHASGLGTVNVTIGFVGGTPGDPFTYTVKDVDHWNRLVREHSADLAPVLTAGDMMKAPRDGKIGILLGFQNGEMMGDDASRVDLFVDKGVRVFQLTYNGPNQLGDGCMAPGNRGLTPIGHAVIERLNARQVMVDLSHSGSQICLDALKASRQPISINHTGCRALNDVPRNKSDEELRLVADRGGFVGIYFMPFLHPTGHASAEDVVAHIEHALNVCGEDQVGIGSDGSPTPVDDLVAYGEIIRAEFQDRMAKGMAAAGEGPDVHPFVDDLRGPNQFRKLASMLAARGHGHSRIAKIMGGNFVRYARDIWGA